MTFRVMALRRTESITLGYWFPQEGTLTTCSKSMKSKSSKLYAKHKLIEARGKKTAVRSPNLKRHSSLGGMAAEMAVEQLMLDTAGFEDYSR